MQRLFIFLLIAGLSAWAQSPSSTNPSDGHGSQSGSQSSRTDSKPARPDFTPPRSDRVNIDQLDDEPGESSSKDTQIDLSPPPDDAKTHPQSSEELVDEGSGTPDPNAFRYWDPHKAAKDVEVGDYYFKRKNYRAAEDRYREALKYKDNDAVATYRLAVCLEKMERPDDAVQEYQSYLQILPHGPEADACHKAIDRLKGAASKAQSAQ